MDSYVTLEETLLSNIGEPHTLKTHLALTAVSGYLEAVGLVAKTNDKIGLSENSPFQFVSKLLNPLAQLNFIKAAAYYFPEKVFECSGLVTEKPPLHIHRMQKQDPYWVGDFYSANMVLDVLHSNGVRQQGPYNVLDVGCSSGSLVRVLAASCPDWSLYGCDPIDSAVEWAGQHVLAGDFSFMGNDPPLGFEKQFFDGVTAISIWSHHRDDAARAWFEEMARVIKSGGWFVVTFCSKHHLLWRVRNRNIPSRKASSIMDALESDGRFFEPVNFSGEDNDTEVNWGYSVFLFNEFKKLFAKYFDVSGYFPGLNQGNQDVLVLVRK